MPDIFLSYNREDQATARRFAEAFEGQGFSVWWDTTLRAGEAYDEVTEAALNEAKAVVVLWSPRSVVSRWVRAEATQADRNKTLVPVTIEACRRPIMFELTQTAELTHWQGEPADKAWLAFLDDVRRFVGRGVQREPPAAAPSAPSPPDRLSICVLPFANMSDDAQQEYFSDGISEDIITDLCKVSALSVTSRNTAFSFKGKHVDLKQVARQLGVSHVLEGSVRKAGNRVRITAQLIAGASDDHVWAERYDRDLDDIFALQDEIAQAIVAALKLKLLPKEKQAISQRGVTSLEAYDKYLRARALANGLTTRDLPRAATMLHEVLEIDPDFAPARGALGVVYAYIFLFLPETSEQTLKAMDAVVRDALIRTPDQWESHLASGILMVVRHDWLAADAALAKVRALAPPSESDASLLSQNLLLAVGRTDEAIRDLESTRNADPLSIIVTAGLMQAYYIARHTDAAWAEYERTKDLPGNRQVPDHLAVLMAWDLGDRARLEAQLKRFVQTHSVLMPIFDQLAGVIDQPAAGRVLLRSAVDDPVNQDATRLMILGWHAALFGDIELALVALRRSHVDLKGGIVFTIWFPLLKEVRKAPAFKQLVRDLGLYDYWRTSGQWGDYARPVGDDDFEIIR